MNKQHRKLIRQQTRRAFTLIEIIVVVTIIALLAAVVAPKLLSQLGGAKVKTTKAKASSVASAVNLYILDMGKTVVPSDFDLDVLLLPPDDGGGPNGPYLEKNADLLDAWKFPFVILVPGDVNYSFDVISYGEDGQPGGEGINEDLTQ